MKMEAGYRACVVAYTQPLENSRRSQKKRRAKYEYVIRCYKHEFEVLHGETAKVFF